MTILFTYKVILANFSMAVSFFEAFFQIVCRCLSKVNLESMKKPSNFTEFSSQINAFPTEAYIANQD